MTLADDIALFSAITLFEDFPPEQLRMLAFGSRRQFLRGGEVLFLAGDPSDGGYVVVTGQIDLSVRAGETEKLLASQLAGSLIGEAALVTANRRASDAVARTNAELIFVPRDLFRRMLQEYPELAATLHARLAATVRGMMRQMSGVSETMRAIPNLTAQQEARHDLLIGDEAEE
ncbi:MAG: cyclic nucleotide-binding domain-containing protein [Nitratireductor sp.]|nr:cyclic nucleotide-binding domain-containing protein [Nitratireductor sp.]